ncbi:hypothetical protein NEOLEDRAFT_1137300 [Neolentinus lepideus HHB14362 ss-1]|uniref:Uncharacterized protein n=1 Tax=Neolentinus lepideus HHB14362 ss-1 TaxID=1314782 RepID=A0A165QVL4_9AGAM|nr:hypothetical protein NEOLEDRAFT_1137300 [Neolentinus lepideus HHB14362 ss-1]
MSNKLANPATLFRHIDHQGSEHAGSKSGAQQGAVQSEGHQMQHEPYQRKSEIKTDTVRRRNEDWCLDEH